MTQINHAEARKFAEIMKGGVEKLLGGVDNLNKAAVVPTWAVANAYLDLIGKLTRERVVDFLSEYQGQPVLDVDKGAADLLRDLGIEP